jgi:hypothetical protein
MTRPEDVIGDFPPDVFELCRRHLGIINTITPLATARHDLFQLSGTIGVGVLKVHVDSLNLKSNFDSPDLWQREHTANLLFQEYSQLLDATPGYLLFEFVDAQPLARRLMAETSSSPASFFEQAAVRASEIHRASRELDPSLLGNFPIDPLRVGSRHSQFPIFI